MTQKEFFIKNREREHKTTVRVLEHFPLDQASFQPHSRSQSALELFKTLVYEERLIDHIAHDEVKKFNPQELNLPNDLKKLIEEYKHWFSISQAAISELTEEQFMTRIDLFNGPVTREDACWLMLLDSIHHRGQLSVYIRMAGGKVPSIYGPSADEKTPPQ